MIEMVERGENAIVAVIALAIMTGVLFGFVLSEFARVDDRRRFDRAWEAAWKSHADHVAALQDELAETRAASIEFPPEKDAAEKD